MIIGIDLGTTNSAAAVWQDGKSVLIPNSLGKYSTPSVVGIEENGEIITGEAAKERLTTFPELTAAFFKRYMGTNREYKLGGRYFRPEELSSFIIASLKKDAELFLNQEISEAVITVPAYFNDTQRKATKIAGEMANLKVERLLNEPTAAALAYGAPLSEMESTFLVFDLGGGTFDVTILEMFNGIMEVRASAGDNFLGGEDFKKLIFEHYIRHIYKHGIDRDELDRSMVSRIDKESERIKILLSQQEEAEMFVPLAGNPISMKISREEFENIAREYIDRIQQPLERVMRDAQLGKNHLEDIFLVGGATRMPLVTQFITKTFKRFPNKKLDPDFVVALGAAVQGALKSRNKDLKEVVLTDVCPYTLGIEIVSHAGSNIQKEGRFLPIIERNTIVPTSRVEYVTPVNSKQKKIDIRIFQGESFDVSDNIFLGHLTIDYPKQCKADEKDVEVRFTYDINGILEIEAKIISLDKKFSLIIDENPGALTKQQIQSRLLELQYLKIHPRDQTRNIAIISRAKRLYEESLGDYRILIGDQLSIFQMILEQQNSSEIEEACKKMTEFLDTIEQV